jgi:SAM-dependent methyltransferase
MRTPWQEFYEEKIRKIFTEKSSVLDIGGGLRVVREKNNRYSPENEWVRPLLEKVNYRILDPVDTYHPDIVGDIHNLPMQNDSEDAVVCIAVLEHVENPIQAFKEIHRVLKPGGYAFIYVPFLYYYHAEKGYYGDYWRFTEDGLKWLGKPFRSFEIMPVRGAFETWVKLSPLGRIGFLRPLWYRIDVLTGKIKSKQVSGYHIFLTK